MAGRFLRLSFGALAATTLLMCCIGCGGKRDGGSSASGHKPKGLTGRFDVGGRKLYLNCVGSGSPTIVYIHGLAGTSSNGEPIRSAFTGNQRFCSYDRANLGQSDVVAVIHTGLDSVADLHALLSSAKVPGPYVLVGASFGGLVAIDYTGKYPNDVKGLLLLDSLLPTDAQADKFVPKAELPSWQDRGNPEGIDENASVREAQPLVQKIPDIPVTYLAATQLDLPPGVPVKRMTALIFKLKRDFIGHFQQGRLVFVESPHYMEAAVPDRIASEIKRLLAQL